MGASDFFHRKGNTMKKLIISIIICISLITALNIAATATEIELFAPNASETQIIPTRDFYVIGRIDRSGISAANMPLNIKIELIDSMGTVVRELKSNVAPNGVTSAQYFMTDYDRGYAANDSKDVNINQFTPPDILFDGADRDTIRSAHNKIVVKEDYFAAVIYGGATKDFDLSYLDEHETPLMDITEGKYTLVITAYDLNDDKVCTYTKNLTFANTQGRVIASDDSLVNQYAQNNNLTLTASVPGNWVPSEFVTAPKDFSYTIALRYSDNIRAEYGKADSVSILLYNLNPNDTALNFKLGSAYESESEKSYLYYNIGEPEVKFSFNGTSLLKKGEIVQSRQSKFANILRSETFNEDDMYADFNQEDGFVLTKGNKTTFYGVFSPFIKASTFEGSTYQTVDSVAFVKYAVTDIEGNTISEEYTNSYIVRPDSDTTSRYEFSFSITPDENLTSSEAAYLSVSLCDANKEEIFSGNFIPLKINRSGNFIGGYDETYWGKSFCDVINFLGQNPNGEALNPDEFITRGDFAAMINRIFGYSASVKATFADLEKDSIYYNDCATAQAVGYMTGDEHGRVTADSFISREQAMIILARISKAEPGKKSVTFSDSDKISFWAKDYVDIMSSNGIVTGFDGQLNPTNSITVAEASALIIKTFKWMHEGSVENTQPSTGSDSGNDLADIGISDTEFISDIGFESVQSFLNDNSDVLSSLVSHIQRNYLNGIYVNRVGNGLEVRDYLLGSFITLPDDALNIITALSKKFAEFSIRYNPLSENAVHFVLGRGEDGKLIGLTYTPLEEVKNKTLTHIEGNWYYYIQK